MNAKQISIEGLCRNMGIDPEGSVDFVNVILSDHPPVHRLEDLTDDAYQTLLSRYRETKMELERERYRNRLKSVISGTPTPEQEKRRAENNDRIMEEYYERVYGGMTPEEIKAKKKANFERICENSTGSTGFARSWKGADFSHLESTTTPPPTPEEIKTIREKREQLETETIEEKRARWAKNPERARKEKAK